MKTLCSVLVMLCVLGSTEAIAAFGGSRSAPMRSFSAPRPSVKSFGGYRSAPSYSAPRVIQREVIHTHSGPSMMDMYLLHQMTRPAQQVIVPSQVIAAPAQVQVQGDTQYVATPQQPASSGIGFFGWLILFLVVIAIGCAAIYFLSTSEERRYE